MFDFCPRCRRRAPGFPAERKIVCPECGFTYYHNIAAGVAVLLKQEDRFVFLCRSREPGWTFPAVSWIPRSRPNIYPCKGIVYRTCGLFFRVEYAPGPFRLSPS